MMLRAARLVLAAALVPTALHAASPYDPGYTSPKPVVQRWSYFCRASSVDDGRLYLTKAQFAFQGRYDEALSRQYSAAWVRYADTMYGAANIEHPTCDVLLAGLAAGARRILVNTAASLHRQVVEVTWRYTPPIGGD